MVKSKSIPPTKGSCKVNLATQPKKPRQPLSSFNLFYRFKRQKVISLANPDKATIISLVEAPPGLEHVSQAAISQTPNNVMNDLRRASIRKDMENNLLPRDTVLGLIVGTKRA